MLTAAISLPFFILYFDLIEAPIDFPYPIKRQNIGIIFLFTPMIRASLPSYSLVKPSVLSIATEESLMVFGGNSKLDSKSEKGSNG